MRKAILAVLFLSVMASGARAQSWTARCNTGHWYCIYTSHVSNQPADEELDIVWATSNLEADGVAKISFTHYYFNSLGQTISSSTETLPATITVTQQFNPDGTPVLKCSPYLTTQKCYPVYSVVGSYSGGGFIGTITSTMVGGRYPHTDTLFAGTLL